MTTCWHWAEMTPAHSVGPFTTNIHLFWFGMHLFFYVGSSAKYISEGQRGRRSHSPREAKKVAGSVIYPSPRPAPAALSDVIKKPSAVLQLHPIFARLALELELKGTVQDFAYNPFTEKKKTLGRIKRGHAAFILASCLSAEGLQCRGKQRKN